MHITIPGWTEDYTKQDTIGGCSLQSPCKGNLSVQRCKQVGQASLKNLDFPSLHRQLILSSCKLQLVIASCRRNGSLSVSLLTRVAWLALWVLSPDYRFVNNCRGSDISRYLRYRSIARTADVLYVHFSTIAAASNHTSSYWQDGLVKESTGDCYSLVMFVISNKGTSKGKGKTNFGSLFPNTMHLLVGESILLLQFLHWLLDCFHPDF